MKSELIFAFEDLCWIARSDTDIADCFFHLSRYCLPTSFT